jgi:hypothetical protein
MRAMNIKSGKVLGRGATVACALFALLVSSLAQFCVAEQSSLKTFSSAEEASRALFSAIQDHNEQAVIEILGAGKDLVASDDEVQDKLDRERFIQKYQEMHRWVREPDGTTVLYIGAENWPFPIPLLSNNGAWSFDSKAGMMEVLFRRIGENEVTAIQACHALVLAEKQDKTKPQGDGSVGSGSFDDAGSLIGALPANAGNGDPATQHHDPVPFHGYYFRILANQGKKAPAGAKSYSSNGKMAGGFAVVAYPAEYRSSGVMTFLVNQDDVVYEKDLGRSTAKLAKAITKYDPDSTWRAAE